MLYILTVPDWPIGKFLQIDIVPVTLIRTLVSVNFAGSLLIAIMCGIVIVQTPRAIQGQGQGAVVQELEARISNWIKRRSNPSVPFRAFGLPRSGRSSTRTSRRLRESSPPAVRC